VKLCQLWLSFCFVLWFHVICYKAMTLSRGLKSWVKVWLTNQ
jgi:hypothetical protein